ncbi:hypothetical protein EVAR_31706_1 [Eumeta japonica]|uniref:Uncharacterized protein n=1 Tax=Eumeta variegata TaxID=151549 RepID=A0A4C1VTB3_EUMVA|nr:hypothetical protein EVAR_31706_1 [Eumeta japonica]
MVFERSKSMSKYDVCIGGESVERVKDFVYLDSLLIVQLRSALVTQTSSAPSAVTSKSVAVNKLKERGNAVFRCIPLDEREVKYKAERTRKGAFRRPGNTAKNLRDIFTTVQIGRISVAASKNYVPAASSHIIPLGLFCDGAQAIKSQNGPGRSWDRSG